MAAGLGFKTFNTGDVLSAADVNGYLMQGVLVFASAAARDAAITSPQEGQFAYLKDTNVTTYYTGSAWANLDTTGMVNPMTTTGDTIYSSSGSTPARLGIGTTGQVLTVAGGIPSWATPAGAGGLPAFSAYATSDQTLTNGTWTKVNFPTEEFDTDSNFASSRFTPTTAGYYQLSTSVKMEGGTGNFYVHLYKNGSDYKRYTYIETAYNPAIGGSICVYANGTSDYYEIYVNPQSSSPKTIGTSITCWFTGVGVRA